jgi:hypothetical protein
MDHLVKSGHLDHRIKVVYQDQGVVSSGANGSGSSGSSGSAGSSGSSGSAGTSGSSGISPSVDPLTELVITVHKIVLTKYILSSQLSAGSQHMFFINGQLLT